MPLLKHVQQSWLVNTLSMKVCRSPGQTRRPRYTDTMKRHQRSPLKV